MTENAAKKIAEYLKNGGRIGNGKVYSISFSYKDGMYLKEGEDMREGDKFSSTYSYEGFIEEIQKYSKSEFVNFDEIISDNTNQNNMLRNLFQKFFKPKS